MRRYFGSYRFYGLGVCATHETKAICKGGREGSNNMVEGNWGKQVSKTGKEGEIRIME